MDDRVNPKTEMAFISGIGPEVTELQIIEHYGPYLNHKDDFSVHFEDFSLTDENLRFALLSLNSEDCLNIIKKFTYSKLEKYHLIFLPAHQVTGLIIMNFSKFINEVDAFHQLRSITPDLKKIQMFNNPENPKESVDFMIVTYFSHDAANKSIEKLDEYFSKNKVSNKKLTVLWRDPCMDYGKIISLSTKALIITNLANKMDYSDLIDSLSDCGFIEKFRVINARKGKKILAVFDRVESVRAAINKLHGKLYHGSALKIKPCKKVINENVSDQKHKELVASFHSLSQEDKNIIKETLTNQEKADSFNNAFLEKSRQIFISSTDKLNEKIAELKKNLEEKESRKLSGSQDGSIEELNNSREFNPKAIDEKSGEWKSSNNNYTGRDSSRYRDDRMKRTWRGEDSFRFGKNFENRREPFKQSRDQRFNDGRRPHYGNREKSRDIDNFKDEGRGFGYSVDRRDRGWNSFNDNDSPRSGFKRRGDEDFYRNGNNEFQYFRRDDNKYYRSDEYEGNKRFKPNYYNDFRGEFRPPPPENQFSDSQNILKKGEQGPLPPPNFYSRPENRAVPNNIIGFPMPYIQGGMAIPSFPTNHNSPFSQNSFTFQGQNQQNQKSGSSFSYSSLQPYQNSNYRESSSYSSNRAHSYFSQRRGHF